MSAHFDRALLLFHQNRHDLAERELRQGLAQEPADAASHALLALCLAQRAQYDEATREAQEAVRLEPALPVGYFALAGVLLERRRLKEAEKAIETAVALDPEQAEFAFLQANIRFQRRRWADALAAAERGLHFDPEHVGCNNLRAMALIKLGRKQEAGATIRSALARDPENAITHANQGWALLEQGNQAGALVHFREALRLDPELEWARVGIVEALKAKHLIYRLILRYFLWMAKLSRPMQWAVILGVLFGQNLLRNVNRSYPQLAPVAVPVFWTLMAFVVMSWIASPLFNLLLRINRFGRLVLSRDQIVASNWLGACVLGMAVAGTAAAACALAGSDDSRLLLMTIELGLLMLPVSATFSCRAPGPRAFLAVIAALLAVAGPVMLALSFVPLSPEWLELVVAAHQKFFPGIALSTWLGVGLSQVGRRR